MKDMYAEYSEIILNIIIYYIYFINNNIITW